MTDNTPDRMTADEKSKLRRGWTTGACATAATKAALELLITGKAPDPVEITLPKGERPGFALALEGRSETHARVGIIKDAGDDPDVTHGAMIVSTVRYGPDGSGITFAAGEGVGTVTKAGLPIAPGEPAINPVPRRMMSEIVEEAAARFSVARDFVIEISVPDGQTLAKHTWNPRLGIVGGISILGTTGVVHPFSCSAWIHSIHRGIDVARANNFERIAGATGSASEAAAQTHYGLTDIAMIDMGDFAGGMLKYLRANPVPNVVVAGGFAKMCKLAQGYLDLHSGRSQVDFRWLADRAGELGASLAICKQINGANTAAEVLALCNEASIPIAQDIAERARLTARNVLGESDIKVDTLVVDRVGSIIAKAT